MATFTINPIAITANVEKDSGGHALVASIHSIEVQLTDSAGATVPAAGSNWLTTTGNITKWGAQRSTDGGVTWAWFEPEFVVAFGTVGKGGQMPAQVFASSQLVGSVGDQFRLAIITDTNITLGAVITVS